jgi:ribosomal protein L21E
LRQGAHGVVRMQVVVPVASMLGWQAGDDLHLNAMPSVSATAGVSAQVLNQPGAKQHSSSPPRPHRRYIGRTAEVVEVPLLSAEEHGL